MRRHLVRPGLVGHGQAVDGPVRPPPVGGPSITGRVLPGGGQLEIRSTVDAGTTVAVTLAAQAEDEQADSRR